MITPWRAVPALILAACLGLGIAAAVAAPVLSFWTWTAFGAAALLLACAPAPGARRRLVSLRPLRRVLGAALAVFALGGVLGTRTSLQPADHVAHRLPALDTTRDVWLEGRVTALAPTQRGGLRLTLSARRIVAGADTHATTGLVQVTRYPTRAPATTAVPDVQAGDVLRLQGRLRPPPRRSNPADFDVRAYLARRGVFATMAIYEGDPFKVVAHESRRHQRLVAALQQHIRHRIGALVPSAPGRMVLHTLLLGDRSQVDAATRRQFVQTGLMHLMAVSGLHVLLVGMVCYQLLGPLLRRLGLGWYGVEYSRSVLTLVLLVLYALVTGAPPSVVRAVLMAGLWIGQTVWQRTAHTLNTVGVAALLMLAWHPAQLFDVGFQLSFAAVIGIVVLVPVLQGALPAAWQAGAVRRGLTGSLAVSLAATLGTLPFLLYHFGYASFAGLLLNAAAIPLTALTMLGGVFMVLFGQAAFGVVADLLARALLHTAAAGDLLFGWASLSTRVENMWIAAALVLGVLALAHWPAPRRRWRFSIAGLGVLTLYVWLTLLSGRHRPALDVIFFDVGQGDAALVTLPGGRHLLIDAGPRSRFADAGRWTVRPHLQRYGIRRLDAVVISHPHSDHLGGLPSLLRSIPVGRVVHNGAPYASDLYEEVNHLLDSLAVPHHAATAGDTLRLDPTVRVEILAPTPEQRRHENPNEASVVVRIAFGRHTLLFLGDTEDAAEDALAARYRAHLRSDVVKVAHHGSATSSTPGLIEQVVPEAGQGAVAVVSVAHNNRYGLPSEAVIRRWTRRGATVRQTRHDGAVWVRSDGRRLTVMPWR